MSLSSRKATPRRLTPRWITRNERSMGVRVEKGCAKHFIRPKRHGSYRIGYKVLLAERMHVNPHKPYPSQVPGIIALNITSYPTSSPHEPRTKTPPPAAVPLTPFQQSPRLRKPRSNAFDNQTYRRPPPHSSFPSRTPPDSA